jgi:hypothetical protein
MYFPLTIFESLPRRKILRLYDIRTLRDVDFNFFFTSKVSFFNRFFFGEVSYEISYRIIEVEWIHGSREIFA